MIVKVDTHPMCFGLLKFFCSQLVLFLDSNSGSEHFYLPGRCLFTFYLKINV